MCDDAFDCKLLCWGVRCVSEIVWVSVVCFYVFFFQAEDGIRDLVRSRGLGDVYKRQVHSLSWIVRSPNTWPAAIGSTQTMALAIVLTDCSVSYTHLTLPTIYSV